MGPDRLLSTSEEVAGEMDSFQHSEGPLAAVLPAQDAEQYGDGLCLVGWFLLGPGLLKG